MPERDAFLAAKCAGDPARRDRVLQLLAADRPAEVGEKAGDHIDRYKLLQQIGEGGMGTVWMAEQREPVQRKVALKIIKLGMDTREVVVRFEAERQALAMMDHPNIATVLDGGATATGRPFFVMELVKGVPITEFCDKSRFALRERLELFTKVCEAIQHAHHKGVIHRDIKPTNVLVTLHDGVPVPKVIDFGIAKATSAELTKKTLFTQFQQMLGTPEYMAPEQAEMSGLDVDTRADVYSLGVLLYELLTGTKPFDMKTALDAGFQELLRTIREVDPAKPSTRISTLGERASPTAANRSIDVDALSRRLRGELDWMVMKAIEKDRRRRYDTPSAFAEDIGRFLRDEAVLAAPPSALYRVRKFVMRRRKTVAAVALITLLLVGGLVGTSFGMWRAGVEAERARVAEAAAQQRAKELEQVSEFQAAQLASVDPQWMGANLRRDLLEAAPPAQRDALATAASDVNFTTIAMRTLDTNVFGKALAAIDEQFAAQPLVRARLLQVTTTTMVQLGIVERALAPQETAVSLFQDSLGADHPETLAAKAVLGVVHKERGDFVNAEKYTTTALAGRRRTLGADARATLKSQHDVGALLRLQGKLAEAEASLRATLAAERQAFGDDDHQTLDTLNSLGVLLASRGDSAAAEPILRELVDGYEDLLGPSNPETLNARNTLAAVLALLGKFDEALPLAREVLGSYRESLGDDHPFTLTAMHTLGTAMQRAGQGEQAVPLLLEAIAGRRRALGAAHDETLSTINEAAQLLLGLGRWAQAERCAREAWDACSRSRPEHVARADAALALGSALRELNRVPEALPFLRESVAGFRRAYGDDSPSTITALNMLGVTLWSAGRPEEAVPCLRECHERQRAKLGADHPGTLQIAANLGINLHETGQLEAALPLLEAVWSATAKQPDLAWVAPHLLAVRTKLGPREAALALRDEVLATSRAAAGQDSGQLAIGLIEVAQSSLDLADWVTAEQLLREVVTIREREQPDAWTTWNAKSMLGAALLGQRKFAEAETVLVASAEQLVARAAAIPERVKQRVAEAVARVVALYEAWHAAEPGAGHAAKVGEWQRRAASVGGARQAR